MSNKNKKPIQQTAYYSLQEACGQLMITPTTLYRWVKDKKIPCYRVGRSWRFKKTEIEQWIENSRQP